MYGLLETYIERSTTPDNASLLFKSIDVLDQAGVSDHVNLLEDWVIATSEDDINQGLDVIYTQLRELLLLFIESNGVRLIDGTPHFLLNDVAEAILIFKHYGDPQYLLSVFEIEYDEETCCLELLSRVNQIPWHVLIAYIDRCDTVALEQFKHQLVKRIEGIPAPQVDLSHHRQRIATFITDQQRKPAFDWVKKGARLNTPIQQLVTQFDEALRDQSDRPLDFADDLFGLLLVSDKEPSDFDAAFKTIMSDYITEVNITTIAYRRFTHTLAQLLP